MNRRQIAMKVEYIHMYVHVSTHSNKCVNMIQVSIGTVRLHAPDLVAVALRLSHLS